MTRDKQSIFIEESSVTDEAYILKMISGNINNWDRKREFKFTPRDFSHVQKLIYEYAGIHLRQTKQHMVYSRLVRRLRATGAKTFEQYLVSLDDKSNGEWENFVNALTTNLTSFFRESHHFDILADHIKTTVFPNKKRYPVSLWCAAVSTGQEAYSAAMTMVDLFGSFTPPVKILATDLDTNVLQKAQQGIYPVECLERISPGKIKRFFLKGTGSYAGFAKVRPELRSIVTFRQMNLLDETWPLDRPFDAIFCRNVMIYFDKPTQYKVLEKFVPLLKADGLLFAGHSESFHHATDLFEMRGKTVYRLAREAMVRERKQDNPRLL